MSTSIPRICNNSNIKKSKNAKVQKREYKQISKELQSAQPYKDPIMFLLYSGHCTGLLCILIEECKQNIANLYSSDGVKSVLDYFVVQPDNISFSMLRAIFFLLLSKDAIMRKKLCETRINWFLPILCPYKACRFYQEMDTVVINKWIKDERVTIVDLDESIRDAYLVA